MRTARISVRVHGAKALGPRVGIRKRGVTKRASAGDVISVRGVLILLLGFGGNTVLPGFSCQDLRVGVFGAAVVTFATILGRKTGERTGVQTRWR
jgi:hypothetical protein